MVWNRVTPFSKVVALVLFVVLPFLGFWLGIMYGENIGVAQFGAPAGSSGTAGGSSDYYGNIAAWQKDSANPDFSIAYPIDFNFQDNYSPAPSSDWRTNAGPGEPGVTAFTLTVPAALEPQTNFADAKLTVGYSANDKAIADCMTPDQSGAPQGPATSTAMLGGTPFTVFHSAGAGAGNYYETTSYRTLHAGSCWAVEYTVHSTQIANYPAEYQLKPFDDSYVTGILDRIVNTFSFTK